MCRWSGVVLKPKFPFNSICLGSIRVVLGFHLDSYTWLCESPVSHPQQAPPSGNKLTEVIKCKYSTTANIILEFSIGDLTSPILDSQNDIC